MPEIKLFICQPLLPSYRIVPPEDHPDQLYDPGETPATWHHNHARCLQANKMLRGGTPNLNKRMVQHVDEI